MHTNIYLLKVIKENLIFTFDAGLSWYFLDNKNDHDNLQCFSVDFCLVDGHVTHSILWYLVVYILYYIGNDTSINIQLL